jgi:hypothetical protein
MSATGAAAVEHLAGVLDCTATLRRGAEVRLTAVSLEVTTSWPADEVGDADRDLIARHVSSEPDEGGWLGGQVVSTHGYLLDVGLPDVIDRADEISAVIYAIAEGLRESSETVLAAETVDWSEPVTGPRLVRACLELIVQTLGECAAVRLPALRSGPGGPRRARRRGGRRTSAGLVDGRRLAGHRRRPGAALAASGTPRRQLAGPRTDRGARLPCPAAVPGSRGFPRAGPRSPHRSRFRLLPGEAERDGVSGSVDVAAVLDVQDDDPPVGVIDAVANATRRHGPVREWAGDREMGR